MTAIGSAGVRRMAAVAFAAAISASMISGPASAAQQDAFEAPSGKVTVDLVSVNGSGCPAGTARATMAPDNTGFHIYYSDFVARDGSGAAPTAYRKNCQIAVQVHVPQGYTYAVASAEYRGTTNLAAGSTALLRSNYYFQGNSGNNVVDTTFAGPRVGGWRVVDSTEVNELVYSPCGKDINLNVNTELRVDSASAPSSISLRSSDGDVETLVHFSWLTC